MELDISWLWWLLIFIVSLHIVPFLVIFLAAILNVSFKRPQICDVEADIRMAPPKLPDIESRDPLILGVYMGRNIHKTVTLTDRRVFEYLSIAILISPGIYLTGNPDKNHIRVDDVLLYSELLAITDK